MPNDKALSLPVMDGDDVERVARAIDPEEWRVIDAHCGPKDNPRVDPDCRAVKMRDDSLFRARAAISSMPLAGVRRGVVEALRELKKLILWARASGGRAGPEAELSIACDEAQRFLDLALADGEKGGG